MPVEAVLSRVRRSEFFAIILPGFTMLTAVWLAFLLHQTVPRNDGQKIVQSLESIKGDVMIALIATLLSYLLGNMVRAVSVNWSDRPIGMLSDKLRSRLSNRVNNTGGGEALNAATRADPDVFPYRSVLMRAVEGLQKNNQLRGSKGDFLDAYLAGPIREGEFPPYGTFHTLYNYMKVVICDDAPGAFEFTQGLEARVRLFAGMFIACGSGFVLILVSLLLAGVCPQTPVVLALLSYALLGIVSQRTVRRVRREEVQYVVLSFLRVLEKQAAKPKK